MQDGRGRLRRRAAAVPRVGARGLRRRWPPRRRACSADVGLPPARQRPRGAAHARRPRRRARGARAFRGRPPSPADRAGWGSRRRSRAAVAMRPCRCGRLGRARGGRGADRGAPRRGPERPARRAGRPDGAKRRRQEHPAAGRGRAARADAAAASRRPRESRCCPSAPATCSCASASATSFPARPGRPRWSCSGLSDLADADPRDLSGGERQRLALAIVVAGRGAGAGTPPGAVLLDEPTRGMDRARKDELAALGDGARRSAGAAVVDRHPRRRVRGRLRRSASCCWGAGRSSPTARAGELLAGGWYFSTEVARVLAGLAVTPADGAEVLVAALADLRPADAFRRVEAGDELAGRDPAPARGHPDRRDGLVRALAAALPDRRAGRGAGGAGGRRAGSPSRRSPTSSRPPTSP